MKKIIMFLIAFIILCFAIPVLFTTRFASKETISNKIENEQAEQNKEDITKVEKSSYDYKQYSKIKLLHSKTNQIEEIALDDYLYGVVSAEMPATFDKEALKAQAVVARTYTIFKIKRKQWKTWRSGYL